MTTFFLNLIKIFFEIRKPQLQSKIFFLISELVKSFGQGSRYFVNINKYEENMAHLLI